MSDEDVSNQEREWLALYERVSEVLAAHGDESPVQGGDYWLLDENWGRYRQEVEVQNLTMLRPEIVKSLQAPLVGYPKWEITIRVDIPARKRVGPVWASSSTTTRFWTSCSANICR